MKISKYLISIYCLSGLIFLNTNCTKIANGFISPTMQYSNKLFLVPQGQIASSNSLVSDGSTIPLNVQWVHIYDSTGKIADDIFQKTYPVGVWSTAYNPLTDTTYASIIAKRTMQDLPPIQLNATSGVLTSNSATLNIPAGNYSLDIQVTNTAGTQLIKNAITIDIESTPPLFTDQDPSIGAFSFGRLIANTPTSATNGGYFNGANNPYVIQTITRFADTPNIIIVKMTDRNGVVFNPAAGEIQKRPNSGLDPVPPFLQNLQDYAPDTYKALDTAMYLKYPVVPFPIASLGNGFNMYYRIPTQFIHLDSTSTWAVGMPGVYYQGTEDDHYLGKFQDGLYDFSIRIPLRVEVPGSYEIDLKLLPVTHR